MKIAVCRKLEAGADDVWEVIEHFGGLDEWFPAIASCGTTAGAVGARRVMTLDGGLGTIVDGLVDVDAERRRLTYNRMESPFPVSSYVGTVEVFESYDRRAVVTWTVEFESDPDQRDGVADLLTSAIGAGVAGLDAHCSR